MLLFGEQDQKAAAIFGLSGNPRQRLLLLSNGCSRNFLMLSFTLLIYPAQLQAIKEDQIACKATQQ